MYSLTCLTLFQKLSLSAKYASLAVLLALLSACATDRPYQHAAPGLVEVDHNRYFDRILLEPGKRLPSFSRVYIEDATVTMNQYWLKNFRGDYTQRDLERIQTSYGKLLKDSLTDAVTAHDNFTLVNSAAEAEIIFRPSLDSLNIYAPDLSFHGRMDQYIHEAGNATFNLVLVDGRNGAVVAQFVDHSETFSNPGRIRERTNRVNNARYFGRLMDRWSNNVMTYLTETDAVGVAK